MKNFRNYPAFTLSEMLITLGIIGIVAALTISIIIGNIKKIVWTNQLKSTFSIMEQGFQKMLAEDGIESLSDTTVFRSMGNSDYCISNNSDECINFYENMKKYFKIVAINKNTGYLFKDFRADGNTEFTGTVIMLSNGAWLWNDSTSYFRKNPSPSDYTCEQIHEAGGHLCKKQGRIYIDVNGNKAPNIIGRDIFMFEIGDNGHLYSFGSKDVCIYSNLSYNYDTCTRPLCDGSRGTVGYSCAERIMRNGWKMDY